MKSFFIKPMPTPNSELLQSHNIPENSIREFETETSTGIEIDLAVLISNEGTEEVLSNEDKLRLSSIASERTAILLAAQSGLLSEYALTEEQDVDPAFDFIVSELVGNLMEHGTNDDFPGVGTLAIQLYEDKNSNCLVLETRQPRSLLQEEQRELLLQIVEVAGNYAQRKTNLDAIDRMTQEIGALSVSSMQASKEGSLGFFTIFRGLQTFKGSFEIRFDAEGHPIMRASIPNQNAAKLEP